MGSFVEIEVNAGEKMHKVIRYKIKNLSSSASFCFTTKERYKILVSIFFQKFLTVALQVDKFVVKN